MVTFMRYFFPSRVSASGFLAIKFENRLSDLDIEVAVVHVEVPQVVAIRFPVFSGVDDLLAPFAIEVDGLDLFEGATELAVGENLVADKIDFIDLDLPALIDEEDHFAPVSALVLDLDRPPAPIGSPLRRRSP